MKRLFVSVCGLFAAATSLFADTYLHFGDTVTISAGSTAHLGVFMLNDCKIQTVGILFKLPEGISVTRNEKDEYNVTLDSACAGTHSARVGYRADDAVNTLAVWSETASDIKLNTVLERNAIYAGPLATIEIAAAETVLPGTYEVELSALEMSNSGGVYKSADELGTCTIVVTPSTGVASVKATETDGGPASYYNTVGMKTSGVQPGINIVKPKQGLARKIVK